jgi:2,4-dienoyl-CoA reductase-like NADH-dependent reductase (Old Yellow Enzyme family)
MSQYSKLQEPLQLGDLTLKNRVFMASLTRNRGIVPSELHVEYYSQRAGAGLILSEGVLIEPQGSEWLAAPGIWCKEQIEGWKKVTEAVHAKGGIIFAQLWHLGRCANTLHNQGVPPPAPSAIRANGGKFRLLKGEPGYSTPQAIENPEHYVQLFKKAAENAKLAGFDGVELHSSGGYLPNQFLESHSNKRTDQYGGSIENRSKFVLEAIDALLEVYSNKRVGIKLTPSGGYNDMGEDTEEKAIELYSYLINQLNERNIAYIQMARKSPYGDPKARGNNVDISEFRSLMKNVLFFANADFSAEDGNSYVSEGKADAIAYGRNYINNPDLPYRMFNSIPINQDYQYGLFYEYPEGKPEIGYSDFPSAQA